MKNILKCTLIIIGTLIGAGFASGQEIATFFNSFLDDGLYGILIASLLFGVIIYFVMILISKYNIEKYEVLINHNKFILEIIKAFTFVCFCIMISAVGAYGSEQYNVSFWYGAIFAGVFCFILFLLKLKGLEKINTILVPLIIIGIFALNCTTYNENLFMVTENVLPMETANIDNWLLSAVLYASYNLILLLPILVELKVYNLNRKDIFFVSALVTLILSIVGFWIYGALSMHYPEILSVELPTLLLAKIGGTFLYWYYSVVILFAIFTTAFACGYSFLRMNSDKNYLKNAALISILGVLLSRVGFSGMINFFFPLFGYFGIINILGIFIGARKFKKYN